MFLRAVVTLTAIGPSASFLASPLPRVRSASVRLRSASEPRPELEAYFAAAPELAQALAALCQAGAPAEAFVAALGAVPAPLLPAPAYSEADLALLAGTVDYLQEVYVSFANAGPDTEEDDTAEDLAFMEEGRRLMAVDRYVVASGLPDRQALLALVLQVGVRHRR